MNYVCEKKQAIEVLKDIKPLAEKAAEVAAALIQGREVKAERQVNGVPVIAVPVVLITPTNVKSVLIDSGFHPASALPSCVK